MILKNKFLYLYMFIFYFLVYFFVFFTLAQIFHFLELLGQKMKVADQVIRQRWKGEPQSAGWDRECSGSSWWLGLLCATAVVPGAVTQDKHITTHGSGSCSSQSLSFPSCEDSTCQPLLLCFHRKLVGPLLCTATLCPALLLPSSGQLREGQEWQL